jgi:electron transport complex protein RnfD
MIANVQAMELRTSPHIHVGTSVEQIMCNVIYALLPISAFAVYQFGISAAALLLVCTVTCVLTEHLVCRMSAKATSVNDYSAVITGMLLALTLPPGFPLWMAVVGGVIAIGVGKAVFGGLGFNVFNPALVGRAFLQAAFPVAITTWTPPLPQGRWTTFIPSSITPPFTVPPEMTAWVADQQIDGWSGATPLALQKFDGVATETAPLFFGMTGGSLGETSAALILVCGLYLVVRRMMEWRVPAAMLLSAFVVGACFYAVDSDKYPSPVFILFSGGLMLGAVFMASDMVASPVTPLGVWIYGGLMGIITVVIRLEGGLPEGAMYAILLGNACSPLIENLTQPRVYGHATQKAGAT